MDKFCCVFRGFGVENASCFHKPAAKKSGHEHTQKGPGAAVKVPKGESAGEKAFRDTRRRRRRRRRRAMNVQKNLRLKSVRTAQVSRRSERVRTRKTALLLSRPVPPLSRTSREYTRKPDTVFFPFFFPCCCCVALRLDDGLVFRSPRSAPHALPCPGATSPSAPRRRTRLWRS